MRDSVGAGADPRERCWTLYVLRCSDGSLYTGIATDVRRRLDEHQRGVRGAKYLRGRGPLRLLLQHPVGDRGRASRAESLVKRLPKERKERLVAVPRELTALLDGLQ
ncbi:MAG TPA: GIY-YIG nuclease family protein [Woeseiaceae bacterium]|nr:GIY-YIG nuclease family protein [Woeseiaceae bacterium]